MSVSFNYHFQHRTPTFKFVIDENIIKKPFFKGIQEEVVAGRFFGCFKELVALASYTMLTCNPKPEFTRFEKSHYDTMCDRLEMFFNLELPIFPCDFSQVPS